VILQKAVLTTNRHAELLRLAAPAVLIACALFLPFIHKAYAIDDPYFLLQALQIKKQFFRPMNFTICWFQPVICGPANSQAPEAALMGYVLLPVIRFASTEAIIHILQFVLLSAGVVAAVSLARRLGAPPFEARAVGMLLVAFPPVLAMTNTVMPDVLAMSLGVIGLEGFQAWLESGKKSAGIRSAIALGFAPYARVHSLGLIAVAGMAAWLHWNRLRSRGQSLPHSRLFERALPLAIAAGIFAALTALTSERGAAAALPPAFNLDLGNVPRNSLALFWYYLVCFPVTAFWLVRVRRWGVWLALVVGVVFATLLLSGRFTPIHAARWTLATLSVLCILHLVWTGIRESSYEGMLGVWLLVPLVVTPYIHLAPKAAMICAPAAAIAGVGMLRRETAILRVRLLSGAIALFAVASLAILQADQRFANLPRQASAELVEPYVKSGERVWFTGQWGLYWYASQAGAHVVVPGKLEPAPGDLLITQTMEGLSLPLEVFQPREVIARRVFAWSGGRVMSQRAGAGLYSNYWGPLPWSLESGEVARFELWRIGSGGLSK
jgi:hypothetical protein